MDDTDGLTIARRVYESLVTNACLDLDDIPYALDNAVRHLREKGAPAMRWALFVHAGG
jgi:hypothetical protein